MIHHKNTMFQKALEYRFNWLNEYIQKYSFGPTLREMGEAWGITHAAAKLSLQAFIDRDWVEVATAQNGRMVARAIRITREDNEDEE